MSDDASYDFKMSGKKIRTLTCPYGIGNEQTRQHTRESAAGPAVFYGRTVEEAKVKATAYVQDVLNGLSKRVDALQRQRPPPGDPGFAYTRGPTGGMPGGQAMETDESLEFIFSRDVGGIIQIDKRPVEVAEEPITMAGRNRLGNLTGGP